MANDIGTFGLPSREQVRDLNADSTLQYNAVPLGTVMRPVPSSMSKAGAALAGISQTLGDSAKHLQTWVKEQEEIEFMNGKLAAAQGKSIEELAKVGGKIATTGYNTYNAEAAADQLLAQGRVDLADSDHALSIPQYRAKLMDTFNTTSKSINTDDPVVNKAFTEHSDKILSTLAAEHVVAHSKYVHEQTVQAGTNYLITKLSAPDTNMDEVKAFITSDMGGLNQESKTKLITDVGITLLQGGRGTEAAANKFKQGLGLQEFKPTGQTVATPNGALTMETVKAASIQVESQGHQMDPEDPSKPYISPAGAVGIAQIMPDTGPEAAKYAGLPWDKHRFYYDADYNKALGDAYLEKMYQRFGTYSKAIAAYNHGPRNLTALLAAHPDDWRQHLPDETFKHLNKIEAITGALDDTPLAPYTQESFVTTAMKSGLSLDQSLRLYKADELARTAASQRFNADLLLQEHSLVKSVRAGEVTLLSAFETIQKMRETMNLTDHQMNSLADKVLAADDISQRNQASVTNITNAIAGNSVNELTSKDIHKAFDITQSTMQGQIAIEAEEASKNGKQYDPEQAKYKKLAEFIVMNKGVVDTRLSEKLQNVSMQDVKLHDGTPNPLMIDQYRLYKSLYEAGGKELASKYAGTAAQFWNDALVFDSGTNTVTALEGAKKILDATIAMPGAEIAKPVIDNDKASEAVRKAFEDRDSVLNSLPVFGKYAGNARWWQRYDSETEALASNPQIINFVKTGATAELFANPNEKDPYGKAIEKLLKGRLEFAVGNALVSKSETSIAEDCGMKGQEGTGAVEKRLLQVVEEEGPKFYKDTWPITTSGDWSWGWTDEFRSMAHRNVPPMQVTYDSHLKQFYVYPEVSTGIFSQNKFASVPLAVSAEQVKAKYMADQSTFRDGFVPGMVKLKEAMSKWYDEGHKDDQDNLFK